MKKTSTTHVPATEPDYGTGKKNLAVYTLGIALCVLLTVIAFGAVMSSMFTRGVTFFIIYAAAILQFLVQVICFLRLNIKTPSGQLNVMSLLFTILVLLVVVLGSLWIMWSLNYRMMH